MPTWLKDNAPVIGALAAALLVLVAILQMLVAGPINRGFDDLRSDMSSRFEAVDKRFNELRSDMNSRFEMVDQRFSDLISSIDGRFDDLRSQMNGRFEAVDQRLDAVDQRLGRLETNVSALRTLSDRVSRNEGQIDFLRDQLQTVDAPTP